MISLIRTYIARYRLARMVERNRQSFEIEQFRRRRAAALKGLANAVPAPRFCASHRAALRLDQRLQSLSQEMQA